MIRRLLLASALLAAAPALARDYGQHGAVFPVIEADLLAVIHRKLNAMQASGAIDAANRRLAARTAAHVRRPPRVPGIAAARAPRAWSVDPTINVAEDLRDGRGKVIVRAGARVNPLDTVPLRQPLAFLDGDDPAQIAWARGDAAARRAKLILVGGSPFALMKAEQRRFFFDQGGRLVRHFGIRAVPALVEQQGRVLRVRELVPPAIEGTAR